MKNPITLLLMSACVPACTICLVKDWASRGNTAMAVLIAFIWAIYVICMNGVVKYIKHEQDRVAGCLVALAHLVAMGTSGYLCLL